MSHLLLRLSAIPFGKPMGKIAVTVECSNPIGYKSVAL